MRSFAQPCAQFRHAGTDETGTKLRWTVTTVDQSALVISNLEGGDEDTKARTTRWDAHGVSKQKVVDGDNSVELCIASAVLRKGGHFHDSSWIMSFSMVQIAWCNLDSLRVLQVEMHDEPLLVCSIFKWKGKFYCVLAPDLGDTTEFKVMPVLNKSIQTKMPLHVLVNDQISSATRLTNASILMFVAPPPPASPATSAAPEQKRPQRSTAKSTPPPRGSPDMSATEEDALSDVSSSDDAKVQVEDCKFCGRSIKMATSRSMQNHVNASRACKARRSLSHCLPFSLPMFESPPHPIPLVRC